jgi:hypothetical protein
MLTLREMIESKLEQASSNITKLAASEPPESEEKVASVPQNTGNTIPKTRLLKMAAQCEYISRHLPKIAAAVGPGEGAGALDVEGSNRQGGIPLRGAATQQTPDKPTEEPQAANVIAPTTVVQTDETDAPGEGQGLEVKTSQVHRVLRLLKHATETSTGPGMGGGTIDLNTPEAADPPIPPEGETIQSLQEVIDVTKKEVKAKPKADAGAYLKEPAQTKAQDPVLHDMFGRSEEAGVKTSTIKVAAARAFLLKIAEQGCTCGGVEECYFCKYAQAVEEAKGEAEEDEEGKKKKEKKEEKEEPDSASGAIQH